MLRLAGRRGGITDCATSHADVYWLLSSDCLSHLFPSPYPAERTTGSSLMVCGTDAGWH